MADQARGRRIAERIKQLVTQGLSQVVKDERKGFITITDVRVTGDTQHASVFYTVLGTEEDRATAAEILENYRGRLRSFVGKGLGIRLTPSLEFILDALPEDAQHLDELLAQVAARDAELAAARAEQAYAGEPDPYRKPRTEAEQAQDELDAQADSVRETDTDDR
ncbi:30S ribosome-binding factor RbfA [Ornithinimicrobium pratense]|uniref:Ribosome-binding factor A n=1 Tax=Ornithinimicrobium pratense TaxID=2593973 RepID=A0A5J6V6J7_9MICO|nr:30S ribosome-binding factor RbfA [Ornithinimicrobium pratense]QFG68924.1 30S ribosome-binding factor RbfA [Ornithinimicrobium pratense]